MCFVIIIIILVGSLGWRFLLGQVFFFPGQIKFFLFSFCWMPPWAGVSKGSQKDFTTMCIYIHIWVWVKTKPQGIAGFGPCCHLPGFHFGCIFLTHSHMYIICGGSGVFQCSSQGWRFLPGRVFSVGWRNPQHHQPHLGPRAGGSALGMGAGLS